MKFTSATDTASIWFRPQFKILAPILILRFTSFAVRAVLSLTVMVGTIFCVVSLTTTMAKVAAVHESWDRIQPIVVRFQISVLILVV